MEVKKRRKFSKEFRDDVLNIFKTGEKNVPTLSKELGIAEPVIYRWYRKSKREEQTETSNLVDKDKEIMELRAKLADITEERDI